MEQPWGNNLLAGQYFILNLLTPGSPVIYTLTIVSQGSEV